ncbi:MAG TPA: hypothetical protein VFS67_34055 [Polyangiaceae bacterium]|nr:hypothetical protein [Polyangiaceae bacterium]
MASRRKLGLAALLLSWGLACTQLFGDSHENTLAPTEKSPMVGALNPAPAAEAQVTCARGEVRCNGALLQRCADDQEGWITVQRCAAAALCQTDPASCRPASCGADEMMCAGNLLQRCNAERTGWDLFDTCLSPAHCNADLRQCRTEPCNAGQRRCDRSDADGSSVLEACREDRQDWSVLDTCVTRELCDQTLNPAMGELALGSDGMVGLAPASEQAIACRLPACAPGEVRCEGAQLQYCAEGRTGFVSAEECATAALCTASLSNLGPAGTPVCIPPACASNEHQCTETGVLQECNEDRSGFRVIQTCIGAPFCSAALADQGQDGCRSAPCEAGQMLCNGAQIQVCRGDRSALDDTGVTCESAELCNATDPANAFCEPPACRRGATSGDEFRCAGAALQRCNESLTGYETIETCVSPALCDASQRFDGCQPPACQPGQHACSGGFLQICNADQTGFENVENCGSQAACDANAGRCADPCQPGSVRCNEQSGDLEECRDLLTGRQTIADCLSLPLCDAPNRRCNPPACAAGARRCETRGANPVITQCAPGREGFDTLRSCEPGQICDAANNECDVCTPDAVRCDGDTLVTCDARGQNELRQRCGPGLCSAAQRRCLACAPPGSARCSDRQLFVCTASAAGEFEASEFCETDELCAQTLASCGRGGTACQCNEGACRPDQVRCNSGQVQRCNAGLTGFENVGPACDPPDLCNPLTGDCNTCRANEYSCSSGQLRQCAADGRSFARQNIGAECASATELRVCNGDSAGLQDCPNGCSNGRGCNQCSGDGVQCVNGDTLRRCVNGFFQDQPCPLGCSAGSTSCNACQGNGSTCLEDGTERRCVNGQFQNTRCPMGCAAGQCASCTASQCMNDQIRSCDDGQLGPPTSCSDNNICNGVEFCANNHCNNGTALVCDDGNPCTDDHCDAVDGCVHDLAAGCIACNGPFCVGNVFFQCVGGRQGASQNCDANGTVCDPEHGGCSPVCGCNGNVFTPCGDGIVGTPMDCGDGVCDPDDGCQAVVIVK